MQAPPHRVTLAGGAGRTVMWAAGDALLPFFSTEEARALRLVSRECLGAVARHPWADRKTGIAGSVAAWRASFPRAKVANASWFVNGFARSTPIVDADFVHFEGLQELDLSFCTDAVTDAAFVHLKGIKMLKMTFCRKITDAAFLHLKGIYSLNMSECCQAAITDAAFVHLKGIHTLDMSHCNQATITDAAFAHLKGIHTLDMSWCTQATITGASFVHLVGINRIWMYACSDAAKAAARAAGLPVVG